MTREGSSPVMVVFSIGRRSWRPGGRSMGSLPCDKGGWQSSDGCVEDREEILASRGKIDGKLTL